MTAPPAAGRGRSEIDEVEPGMTTWVRRFLLAVACLVASAPAPAVVLQPGDLLVVDAGSAAPAVPARVIRIHPGTGAQEIVTSGGHLVEPLAIAIEPAGTLLVADGGGAGGAAIVRIDPATGAQGILGDGAPVGIAVDPGTGEIFITDGFDGGVLTVDPATGATTPLAGGAPLDFTQSLVFAPDGLLYVADFDVAWSVVRVDPADGDASPLAASLSFVGGLAASAGSVWATQPEQDAVVRLALPGGSATPVSSGNDLRFPFGVAVEAGGTLVVADWGDAEVGPAIVRVVPGTGAQDIVADAGFLTEPWGIAVVAPEPGALSAALSGCLGVLLLRRWRAGA